MKSGKRREQLRLCDVSKSGLFWVLVMCNSLLVLRPCTWSIFPTAKISSISMFLASARSPNLLSCLIYPTIHPKGKHWDEAGIKLPSPLAHLQIKRRLPGNSGKIQTCAIFSIDSGQYYLCEVVIIKMRCRVDDVQMLSLHAMVCCVILNEQN